jgi:hypothetical protein
MRVRVYVCVHECAGKNMQRGIVCAELKVHYLLYPAQKSKGRERRSLDNLTHSGEQHEMHFT